MSFHVVKRDKRSFCFLFFFSHPPSTDATGGGTVSFMPYPSTTLSLASSSSASSLSASLSLTTCTSASLSLAPYLSAPSASASFPPGSRGMAPSASFAPPLNSMAPPIPLSPLAPSDYDVNIGKIPPLNRRQYTDVPKMQREKMSLQRPARPTGKPSGQ